MENGGNCPLPTLPRCAEMVLSKQWYMFLSPSYLNFGPSFTTATTYCFLFRHPMHTFVGRSQLENPSPTSSGKSE